MNTIAIMQPYFLPYIGYWQLINAVDSFVILDNVNFIKKGYINRNAILLNKEKHIFTIPIKNLSQNQLISQTELNFSQKEKQKFLIMVQHAYKHAPFYSVIYPITEEIINCPHNSITQYIYHSLKKICTYLDIKTQFCFSSQLPIEKEKGQIRILNICKHFNAQRYINPINGKSLYSKELFRQNNIELLFLRAIPKEYPQGKHDFIPFLSILDILMFNSKEQIINMLQDFQLERN